MKFILTENLLAIDCGIDWSKLDWQQPKAVNAALEHVLNYIKAQKLSS